VDSITIGVISDTHGRFDAALHDIFAGVERIVHAGDVGSGVLEPLRAIAPVTAVRGNVDGWLADELPLEATLEIAGRRLLVAHVREHVLRDHEPAREGVDIVVTGHSHRFTEAWQDGVLYLNPGAAGAARFGLPRTVALLELNDDGSVVQKVALG
jgi:putative phosphoesterase